MNVTSLSNWIDGKKPVIEEESHFLDLRADLTPLSFQEDQSNFMEDFLERHCYKFFVTEVRESTQCWSKELTFIEETPI
jgi:hypothetical protein